MSFKLFHGLLLQLAVTDAVNIPSDSSNRVSLAKRAEVLSNLPLQAFITHYLGKGLLALSKSEEGGILET